MARIVTVYTASRRTWRFVDMSFIRWLKISEALARRGHEVDIATNEWRWWVRRAPVTLSPSLRVVPLTAVRWDEYDAVKTLFHRGFETLRQFGGASHPFIIAKLGSVVAPEDQDGIFFYGTERERLFEIQQRVAHAARYVTVLSPPARDLWRTCFGPQDNVLVVPGAVDAAIPPPGPDPYEASAGVPRCLFAGNFYSRTVQPEANRILVDKLNRLGRALAQSGVRLYLLGPGDARSLDREAVTYLGSADYQRSWDFFYHANVGIVVTGGGVMHNNESTKIYHYLRAGLPVVSEAGFPNDHVVRESGLGDIVPNGDIESLAERVAAATRRQWDKAAGMDYILTHHTWDSRAALYDAVLAATGSQARSRLPDVNPPDGRGMSG